jgi:DNA-binding transcriptional MerR regulator
MIYLLSSFFRHLLLRRLDKGLDIPVTGRYILTVERAIKRERAMKVGVTIGKLAKELHLNPKTIRYYEEVGLLSKPRRSESGYRLYSDYEIERLRLVTRAKLLGLSLVEIKELVEYAIDGRCNALEQRLLSLVEIKLGEIDRKMHNLATFRGELARYKLDLSSRLLSICPDEHSPSVSGSCSCIGEEVDSLKK